MSFSGQASTFFAQQCNTWMARAAECLHLTNQGASCLLQEPLINSQTSKTQIPNSKSGSTSGDWSDLLLHGFSLNGAWFLSSGHSLQKHHIYIFISPLPVRRVLCLPEQLATAGVSRVVDTHVLSWVSQALCWDTQNKPWSSRVTLAFPDCRTACVVLVFVALCIPEGLFVCFTAFQFDRVTFSGGRGHRRMWLGWCISVCWTWGEKQRAVLAE